MTWIVWRQYRFQAAVSAALLAAFAVFTVITGLHLATTWHNDLVACTAANNCTTGEGGLFNGSGDTAGLIIEMTLLVPALLGLFWGAPLVAHELETGSLQWTWVQSVTRTRWFAAKAGCLLLAAAVWGGAVAALVTWWAGPRNALYLDAFTGGNFDIQGIVPVGYALFAMALGIMAGTLLRRTIPAMAITLGGFVAVRLVITLWVRRHYMAAVTTYANVGTNLTPKGSYWQYASGLTGPNGPLPQGNTTVVIHPGALTALTTEFDGVSVNELPKACQAAASAGGPPSAAANNCLTSHHIQQFITYQPASRYWAFQGIETGIYALIAAALIAVTIAVIRRRDA
jgi:ABC-type transport system involved in multi-copper enzyme maturation permease subunit